jgi:hypothetical protein
MGKVTYVEDIAALRSFLSWEGPPGRDFERRMRTLAFRQTAAAPRRTGKLAGQVTQRRMQSDFGRYLEGASGVNPGQGGQHGYALYQSQGTRPHIIQAKRGKSLRFIVAGRTVFARRVNHPGTRPNPYLTRHLREFVR